MEEKEKDLVEKNDFIRKIDDYSIEIKSGTCLLYPRGDGSMLIDRIGPMLGTNKCNVKHLDVCENQIIRGHEVSYKDILARISIADKFSDKRIIYNYMITEELFNRFWDAYSKSVDRLNKFCSVLENEEFKHMIVKEGYVPEPQLHVLRKINKDDELHIGMCLLSITNKQFTLIRLENHQASRFLGDLDEWSAIEFRISPERITYCPQSTFTGHFIDMDIPTNEQSFCGPKRICYCEITQETFDEFERIYSEDTYEIQKLREAVVRTLDVMNYEESVKNNHTDEEPKNNQSDEKDTLLNENNSNHNYSREDVEYASTYSTMIYDYLSEEFRKHPEEMPTSYWIGANDVSDYVLNAILNTIDGHKYPKFSKPEIADKQDNDA